MAHRAAIDSSPAIDSAHVAPAFRVATWTASHVVRAIMLAILITWVPLAALTLVAGTAYGDQVTITFFADHTPHGRFLVALPLLLLMDAFLARRSALMLEYLDRSDLVPDTQQAQLQVDMRRVERAWRSRIAFGAILLLSYAGAIPPFLWQAEADHSNWMLSAGEPSGLSYAGAWNVALSAPLVRFCFIRAFWHLAVWAWFLTRIARCDLALNPLHPDGRCGLRVLGQTQLVFIPLIAAFGTLLGCFVAFQVKFSDETFASFYAIGGAFLVLSLLLILGPLIVFARSGFNARQRGELAFSLWASYAATHLSKALFAPKAERVPETLGTPEISSLCDASSLFDRAIASRSVPIDRTQVLIVLICAAASVLLPLLTLLPLVSILKALANLVL